MIEAMPQDGRASKVKAICDDCHRPEVIACDYMWRKDGWDPDLGQAHSKLTAHGWTLIKGVLRCPKCEAKRKAYKPKEAPMPEPKTATVTDLRQPTREQRRQIFEMLTVAYDIEAQRYRGNDSDLTIAEAIGGGCMFGWVAERRELDFGPAGGNEEQEKLLADLKQWQTNADKLAADLHLNLREFNDARLKVKDLSDRLAAVIKAVGPKAKAIA